MFKNILAILAAFTLVACGTTGRRTDLKIHQINALSSVNTNDGSFRGLEFLADPLPGKLKSRVNIFYVHGIGWTENPDSEALAKHFIDGIKDAYGLSDVDVKISSQCADESHVETGETPNHMFITTQGETFFQTALPGSRLKMDRLVCMDKHTITIDDVLEFVIYRAFWDDLFWNGLQFQHVGQDDATGSSSAIANLRRKYNRKLKDDLVNYGFSDAVMYLGPAGTELRRAVQGAMCSAALDASGYTLEKQGHELAYTDACKLASWKSLETHQFAFVTESLGSKIVYDVMQESLTDGQDNVIDDMISGSEFFMLANQLPLLSLNDLSNVPRAPVKHFEQGKQPKIIAMSELNDFLTYELIPFFEQLWKRSYRKQEIMPNVFENAPSTIPPGSQEARNQIVDAIGFDIIDMRMEYADGLIPLIDDLVDPLEAHSGHMSQPELVLYLLCGAHSGKLNGDNCLAKQRPNSEADSE